VHLVEHQYACNGVGQFMGESGEPCFIFPEEGTDDEKADYTSYKPQIRTE
jgi:hypothetical protein